MDYNDIVQMIRITKQYYELGRTQDEIAQVEHISKSTVSRILKRAQDKGYITILINHCLLYTSPNCHHPYWVCRWNSEKFILREW